MTVEDEIVATLASSGRPMTGYQIARTLATTRPPIRFLWWSWRDWPGYGTLYGALDHLRDAGRVLVEIEERADGPPRYWHRLVPQEPSGG